MLSLSFTWVQVEKKCHISGIELSAELRFGWSRNVALHWRFGPPERPGVATYWACRPSCCRRRAVPFRRTPSPTCSAIYAAVVPLIRPMGILKEPRLSVRRRPYKNALGHAKL